MADKNERVGNILFGVLIYIIILYSLIHPDGNDRRDIFLFIIFLIIGIIVLVIWISRKKNTNRK